MSMFTDNISRILQIHYNNFSIGTRQGNPCTQSTISATNNKCIIFHIHHLTALEPMNKTFFII